MSFSARHQCHYRHQRWPCLGMRNPTIHPVNISSPRSRLSDLFGDFFNTGHWVTGWSVSRGFCSCTNLGSLGQIWNLQVGYLRYPDSRISWCSCWRAMAILIILGWATPCIPRKSLANMSCEKMWILSAENGLIMMWRCYRPVPSHPDMGFDLVGLFGKKPSSPVIWTWMLNVC